MARKNRMPEENALRAKIRELLLVGNISSIERRVLTKISAVLGSI